MQFMRVSGKQKLIKLQWERWCGPVRSGKGPAAIVDRRPHRPIALHYGVRASGTTPAE